jgi:hypothetical protein
MITTYRCASMVGLPSFGVSEPSASLFWATVESAGRGVAVRSISRARFVSPSVASGPSAPRPACQSGPVLVGISSPLLGSAIEGRWAAIRGLRPVPVLGSDARRRRGTGVGEARVSAFRAGWDVQ